MIEDESRAVEDSSPRFSSHPSPCQRNGALPKAELRCFGFFTRLTNSACLPIVLGSTHEPFHRPLLAGCWTHLHIFESLGREPAQRKRSSEQCFYDGLDALRYQRRRRAGRDSRQDRSFISP